MKLYDMIIIGGGPSGLAAAIYAARFDLKNLVIAKEPYGLIAKTDSVENWPGEKKISGLQLMTKMEEQAKSHPLTEIKYEDVVGIKKTKDGFSVKTPEGTYDAKTLLFATGTQRRKLGVPGEKEFANKGVSYCATCDAPLFKGKIVCVVGGGDSAVKESIMLSSYAKKVYIIHRGSQLRAEPVNLDYLQKLLKSGKVETVFNANVKEIKGDKFVNAVVLDSGKTLGVDGIFVEIGGVPQSELAKSLGVALNDKGEIIIDFDSKTNVPGVYAAGDVASRIFKQAITGAAEGVGAAFSANNYIKGKK